MKRTRTITNVSLSFVMAVAVAVPVYGWGANGHRAVGEIGQRHLSEKALRAVLDITGGVPLASLSTWPDDIRSDPDWRHQAPWHFVSIDSGEDFATFERSDRGDVLEALDRFEAQLRDPDVVGEERWQALAFFIHFVGDIHQPLHVGRRDDRGGNSIDVTWFGDRANLHQVWDSRMISQDGLSFSELADFVDHATLPEQAQWLGQSYTEWAAEARTLREMIYEESGNFEGDNENPRLGYEYSYRNFGRVEEQILKGGLRLAERLNAVFDGP